MDRTAGKELFQTGNFRLASGRSSPWKIECDALASKDWQALAMMAMEFLPPFREVVGVPTGGLPFAEALKGWETHDPEDRLLIVDDVFTTGKSIEAVRGKLELVQNMEVIGLVAFARGKPFSWVQPLFQMPYNLFESHQFFDLRGPTTP